MRTMPTRVLLADDHALIRQGLKAFLERKGFQVVGEASDGQEAIRSVEKTQPDVAIKAYVLKSQAADDLVHAIEEVCRGSVYLSPNISRAVVDAYLSKTYVSTDPLSGRERQVLQLVGEGKSTKDIAVHLGISVKTAESHRARLMKKLDIHETASLVRYAIRRGLIQP